MRFKITRASDFNSQKPPCAGAAEVKDWGTWKEWEIEIADLDGLLAIMAETGQSLILNSKDSITVYDDYVE